MAFEQLIERVGQAAEIVGMACMVAGIAASLVRLPADARKVDDAYGRARRGIGRSILLGLEILVAGDIIRTVAISPSFTSVGVLAVIVLIRSFLSMTLEVEITGRWPWARGGTEPALPTSRPDGQDRVTAA